MPCGHGQVQRFSQYLSTLNADGLARRYDPERMTRLELSPDAIWKWKAEPNDSPLEWLIATFEEVRRFVDKAAAAGDCLIIAVS